MLARIIIGAFILGLWGCGASGSDAGAELSTGAAMFSVDAVTGIGDLTAVTVSVSPAGIDDESLTYDSSTTSFTGTLVVPAGYQTFTVEAFVNTNLVGQGEASATIVEGETANILITVFDSTGAQPGVDCRPMIGSLVISRNEPVVGEVINLSAQGIDVDGDTLSYQWADNCATTTFTTPTAANTNWFNSTAGECELSLTVTANGLSAQRIFTMTTKEVETGSCC